MAYEASDATNEASYVPDEALSEANEASTAANDHRLSRMKRHLRQMKHHLSRMKRHLRQMKHHLPWMMQRVRRLKEGMRRFTRGKWGRGTGAVAGTRWLRFARHDALFPVIAKDRACQRHCEGAQRLKQPRSRQDAGPRGFFSGDA